jgi:hypothetical protein
MHLLREVAGINKISHDLSHWKSMRCLHRSGMIFKDSLATLARRIIHIFSARKSKIDFNDCYRRHAETISTDKDLTRNTR